MPTSSTPASMQRGASGQPVGAPPGTRGKIAAIVLNVAPPQIVLSGFQSSTFWLLFSGMVLGSAIRLTGLGARMVLVLSRFMGHRYGTAISGIAGFSLMVALIVSSSMGRIALLVPIVLSLAERMG